MFLGEVEVHQESVDVVLRRLRIRRYGPEEIRRGMYLCSGDLREEALDHATPCMLGGVHF